MPHTRETFTTDELSNVLSHYDLGNVTNTVEFPRGSHASAKTIVTTDRGKYLVKRRPRGKTDPFRVAFAHDLQNYLAEKNFPLPHLIGTTADNNSMLKLGEIIYEVFEFVEGGHYDASISATEEAGRTLALYHKLVHEFHPHYEPPRGQYHDSAGVRDALPRVGGILAGTPAGQGKHDEIAELIVGLREAYTSAAAAVNKLGMPSWEVQIVHSDWHPGNLLFERKMVVAVLDYDAARMRQRVTDIANGCLQFSMVTAGRDLSTWEDRTDVARANRFLKGYDELNVISQDELRVLPHLMQEALIAQAVPPILKTGTFAGLEGLGFLHVMMKKVSWLKAHGNQIGLDLAEQAASS